MAPALHAGVAVGCDGDAGALQAKKIEMEGALKAEEFLEGGLEGKIKALQGKIHHIEEEKAHEVEHARTVLREELLLERKGLLEAKDAEREKLRIEWERWTHCAVLCCAVPCHDGQVVLTAVAHAGARPRPWRRASTGRRRPSFV